MKYHNCKKNKSFVNPKQKNLQITGGRDKPNKDVLLGSYYFRQGTPETLPTKGKISISINNTISSNNNSNNIDNNINNNNEK